MTWDSFRQRVRYLRGEALGNWPSSVSDVFLQSIRHPQLPEDDGPYEGGECSDDSESCGVHVWFTGTDPARGMRKTTLLSCTVPSDSDSAASMFDNLWDASSTAGAHAVDSDGATVHVPVAAARSVWSDKGRNSQSEGGATNPTLLAYLRDTAIEQSLWQEGRGEDEPTNVILLADKGRRWISGTVTKDHTRVSFSESTVVDDSGQDICESAALGQRRDNDWYYARGGHNCRFVALSRGSNVVVYDTLTRKETKVTWATAKNVQYGAVEYSMEEELGRSTGIFWAPSPSTPEEETSNTAITVDRLLCSRVDEALVHDVGLPELPIDNKINPTADLIHSPASLFASDSYSWSDGCLVGDQRLSEEAKDGHVGLTDFQKYPRPGSPNAVTDWVVVEIEHDTSRGIVGRRVRKLLPQFCLRKLFPWCEYVVRAGWMPMPRPAQQTAGCQSAVWLQLLDRAQKHTEIVRIPLACFDGGTSEEVDPFDTTDIEDREPSPKKNGVFIDVLYEETQPKAWINLNLCCRFLKPRHDTPSLVRFILATERTNGFSHLHLVTAHLDRSGNGGDKAELMSVRRARQDVVPLTRGKWPVTDDAPLFVDEKRHLVYFSARRPNPLTVNLFAVSYAHALSGTCGLQHVDLPRQLTLPGYSHSHFAFDSTGTYFYCQSSNLTTPVRHCIYRIQKSHNSHHHWSHICGGSSRDSAYSYPGSAVGQMWAPGIQHRRSCCGTPSSRQSVISSGESTPLECGDDAFSDTVSFYTAISESPGQLPTGKCLAVLEMSNMPLPAQPQTRADVETVGSRRNISISSSTRWTAGSRTLRRLSTSSSSLSSHSQSIDSVAPSDDYLVAELFSKSCSNGGQIHHHGTAASELFKLKRLTPAYVSQRVTKAVKNALPFCHTQVITPFHLLQSTLFQPLNLASAKRKPHGHPNVNDDSTQQPLPPQPPLPPRRAQPPSVEAADPGSSVGKRGGGSSLENGPLSALVSWKPAAGVIQRMADGPRALRVSSGRGGVLHTMLGPIVPSVFASSSSSSSSPSETPPRNLVAERSTSLPLPLHSRLFPQSRASSSTSAGMHSELPVLSAAGSDSCRKPGEHLARRASFMPLRSSLTRATQSFVAKETLVGVHSTGTALPELTRGGDPVPKLFCFPVPKIGSSSSSSSEYDLLFGHVYLPPDFKPGTEYPVMVNAYGGPQCQLVTNAYPYPRHRRLAMLARMTPALAKAGVAPEFAPVGLSDRPDASELYDSGFCDRRQHGEEASLHLGDLDERCSVWTQSVPTTYGATLFAEHGNDDSRSLFSNASSAIAAAAKAAATRRPSIVESVQRAGDDGSMAGARRRRRSSQNEALGAMSRMQAMVVVCVDGRGTPHRGLAFESAIGGSLGCVEVEDIVCALEYLAEYGLAALAPVAKEPPAWCRATVSTTMAEEGEDADEVLRPPVFPPPSASGQQGPEWDSVPEKHACAALVDRTRVAIHGWSYGGYVTLRALASHPEWFKVAIAGAPVVRWDWYSAAYSERYLGVLPHSKDATGGAAASDAEQATVDAYEAASVTSVADKLPRDRNRLLVVHGWNDDNVHVAHTAELVRSLQRSWGCLESTRLSVYANERHGLRLPSSNEHFETLLTFWLFYFL